MNTQFTLPSLSNRELVNNARFSACSVLRFILACASSGSLSKPRTKRGK